MTTNNLHKNGAELAQPVTAKIEEILTKREAAALIRIKARTLDDWMRRKIIPFSKLPRGGVRFQRTQLIDFIRKFEVSA